MHEDPETGLLSVSYAEILPVLIEAFKEFLNQYKGDKIETQVQLQELREKLDNLSNEFATCKFEMLRELELISF